MNRNVSAHKGEGYEVQCQEEGMWYILCSLEGFNVSWEKAHGNSYSMEAEK